MWGWLNLFALLVLILAAIAAFFLEKNHMTRMNQLKLDNIKLLSPLKKDDGSEAAELVLKPLTQGERAAIMKDEPEEREAFKRLACACCGLSIAEVERLKMPDWNTLVLKLSDWVSQTSAYFAKADKKNSKVDDGHPLLLAVNGDDGRLISKVTLTLPSLATTELMMKQVDDNAKNGFISRACTGLSAAELDKLSCPDWNSLQRRINDFLNETADYFRAET